MLLQCVIALQCVMIPVEHASVLTLKTMFLMRASSSLVSLSTTCSSILAMGTPSSGTMVAVRVAGLAEACSLKLVILKEESL